MAEITPIVMPKWGLSMKEGKVNAWLVEVGTRIEVGMPILDVETDKIANEVEAPDAGLLRRQLAAEGDVLPVKALLGVLAEESVSDAEIDAFIAAYQVPDEGDGEEDETGPSDQHVEVDGIRVRYQQTGSGSPVLLIHGFGGDLNNWLFNIDELASRHTVIALDLPAHGASDVRLPASHDLAGMAAFVHRFLQETGYTRVDIMAHSMGGAIAVQLAQDVPDAVGKLVLVSPCGFGEAINMGYVDGFIDAESRRDLKPVLGLLLADPSAVTRAMVDESLRYKRLDGVQDALRALRDAMFADGRQRAFPGLALDVKRHPLLLLWGRDDQVVPVAHAEAAPDGTKTVLYEASGHMCHMDHAAEVNPVVLAFLEGS